MIEAKQLKFFFRIQSQSMFPKNSSMHIYGLTPNPSDRLMAVAYSESRVHALAVCENRRALHHIGGRQFLKDSTSLLMASSG